MGGGNIQGLSYNAEGKRTTVKWQTWGFTIDDYKMLIDGKKIPIVNSATTVIVDKDDKIKAIIRLGDVPQQTLRSFDDFDR